MTRKNEILQMRFKGMSYAQIGKKFGISRQRVQKIISPPPYIRKAVFKKAAGKCQDCGILVGRSWHIHHKGNSENEEDYNDGENLELLCLSCHAKLHMPFTDESRTLGGMTHSLKSLHLPPEEEQRILNMWREKGIPK